MVTPPVTAPARLEVGLLLSSLGVMRGGLETTVADLAAGLAERGHAISIVTGSRPGHGLPGELRELPVRWVKVPCLAANHPLWHTVALRRPGWPLKAQSLSFVASCRLNPAVRRVIEYADATLTALEIETVLISSWRKRRGRPNLSVFPGVIDWSWFRRDVSAVRVAVSQAVAGRLREIGGTVDGVVLAGPPEAWLRISFTVRPVVRTLLYVGRLEPNKGVLDLLAIFESLATEFPDLRLRLLGDGPQRSVVRERAARAELSGRVESSGSVSRAQVHQALREADLFVFPSRYESFSQALLEAAAVGVPAVASDIPGNREAAGGAACLLPVGDRERWTDALRSLILDRERRVEMSAAGRDRVRLLTSLQATRELEGFLRLALARGPGPAAAAAARPVRL